MVNCWICKGSSVSWGEIDMLSRKLRLSGCQGWGESSNSRTFRWTYYATILLSSKVLRSCLTRSLFRLLIHFLGSVCFDPSDAMGIRTYRQSFVAENQAFGCRLAVSKKKDLMTSTCIIPMLWLTMLGTSKALIRRYTCKIFYFGFIMFLVFPLIFWCSLLYFL